MKTLPNKLWLAIGSCLAIAACSMFTALLLIADGIRKIRAWRALTNSDKTRTAQRARRRTSAVINPATLPCLATRRATR